MQRQTPVDRRSPTTEATTLCCPVCGEPVRGIAAARPGEHRFVGCDHYASARFLPRPSAEAAPIRLGP